MPRVCGVLLNGCMGPYLGRLGVHGLCFAVSVVQQPVLMLRCCPTS